jgi:hypothetical protein
MNSSHFSMRNLAMVALLLLGFNSVALADAPVTGKVAKVDPNAHTFTVQYFAMWHSRHGNASRDISHERIFKVTDKTTYLVGSTKGSWANVTKGAKVTVTAHTEGSDKVADKVQIVSGS